MATKSEKSLAFLKEKKREMKESRYRTKFDQLALDIKANLIDTNIQYNRIEDNVKTLVAIPTVRPDGSTDFAILPRVAERGEQTSRVPRSAEPINLSKILTAASVISSNTPDGTTYSVNKIKARAYYELWKRSWSVPEMNGYETLDKTTQNNLTYGWAAWRIFPKQIIVDKTIGGKMTKKILFDDVYREALDPRRTWLGLSYKPFVNDNRPEVLYEIDITLDAYKELKKRFNKRNKDDNGGVSEESLAEDATNTDTRATISFYENPIENRYIIASESTTFYDGEMPNDEVYGSVVVNQCFSADMNDPYGVGLFEMMRGNSALYNYINSLNAEQVEAEIFPLLFGTNMTGQGDMTYSRSPNKINPIPSGAKVEKILTTGNVTLGINYANAQKDDISDNTGVNDIVAGAGSSSTLGSTVILKEAALNRLIKPRNSLKQSIENDFCIFISWLEQDQANSREFIFSNPEEMKAFMDLNPEYHSELGDVQYDENGIPVSYQILASMRVPMNFDYSQNDLTESDFQNQNIDEFGDSKVNISKEKILGHMKQLDDPKQLGYSKVVLKVDGNSMLVPSMEIKKQSTMQLFPIIQNTIQIIFGLARQDPEQAKAQLTSLKTFLDIQKENIYDYIPKSQYDAIMAGALAQPMMPPQQQADGTNVAQPQNPQEMSPNQSPMSAAMDASIGRASKQG